MATTLYRIGRLTKRINITRTASWKPEGHFERKKTFQPYLLPWSPPARKVKAYSTSSVRPTIYTSPVPDLSIKEESLAEYFLPKFEKFGNRDALVDNEKGKKYTYIEMRDAIIKVGSALNRLGYKKGDVICMCSTNNSEYAILLLACVTSGLILTSINPAYTSDEIALQLCHSGASCVVVIDSLLSTVKEAVESDGSLCRSIKNIIVNGSSDGYRSFTTLLEDDGRYFPENISIDPNKDVALLPYSSGTTGLPKGVMLTHMNLVSNLQQIRPLFRISPNDVSLCLLPMFHAYGMIVILMDMMQDGGKVVSLPCFEPESFLSAIVRYRVTKLHLVPPIALFLAKHPLVANYDLSCVNNFVCAAAPLGEALSKEFQNRLQREIAQGYGMTELSPAATLDTKPPHEIGTVGVLVPNSTAKVVCPETGRELGPTENGEVCIKGPHVMKGYLNNEEATKDMIKDGWLHTGDIGHVKENGRFVITDRLKELIKYKGFQVAPAELEDLLLKHPGLQDAAVIGMPDEEAGEIPRAYVVPKPNVKVTPDEIIRFVEENTAPHKKLRGGVEFLPEIPKSASGKILRRILRNML